MKTDLPRKVTLTEVGPRDGFQLEAQVLPLDVKIDVVAGLVATGVDRVRVAECALKLEAVLGRQLPGKMLRVIQASGKNGRTSHGNPLGNG
jgi:hypothetical protein